MSLINQIKAIVNDAVEDALGKNSTLSDLDTTDIVSLGQAISSFDAYEDFFRALANRIAKTVYFVRTYETNDRSILRDEHEYGAFIQKVYYNMPSAVDNPAEDVVTWSGSPATATYDPASPYDVTNVVGVTAMFYGGKGTWSVEILRPISQIKSAFLSDTEMLGFIDGIYRTVDNAYKLEQERVVAMAANTAIAHALNAGLSRNLLAEYNTLNSTNPLSLEEALQSADFYRYASKEIKTTISHMKGISTLFNAQGYETFTDTNNLVVEVLSDFESGFDTYLSSDTFHNELVKLPRHNTVEYWQGSGSSFAFDDISTIDIIHDKFKSLSNATGEISQSGIVCFIHDVENVAAYFGDRYTWEQVNVRARTITHGEQAIKGFAVDTFANSFVFYLEEVGD